MVDTRLDLREEIMTALRSAEETDFAEWATRLLAALGYRSERTLPNQTGAVDEFLERFPPPMVDTSSERNFREAAESIHVLFQETEEEIAEGTGVHRLFSDDTLNTSNIKSFLFAAVNLIDDGYPRGRYADFTREVNKRFPNIPSVVLFRTATGRITLAFVHVRPNKRNPERNVIGRVSLIREIDPKEPHRAHVSILSELSLKERLRWMEVRGKSPNFDGLLDAWLDALNTEELNRRFYQELLEWFDRAVQPEFTRFPTTENKVIPPQEHVIRIITRMLFVWFIKEKGLVAPELFVETQVAPLLKGYDRDNGDSYYRAVLQNLFFATLNTELGHRGFSNASNPVPSDFTSYRFRSEMADPDTLTACLAKTPFINGGLFDCLDGDKSEGQGGYRIDCFTDTDKRLLSIPNYLFFGPIGLIDLFERYKFTVEENTPVEVEVALDPELLGKVFENLLAAYNPETKESARKQTGSYYTPRAVVDYMVDEALVASLAQKARPGDRERKWWEDRLHYLLDYNDAGELFLPNEAERVVRAIADLRVLDPAVGSGAFPMGVLHKLTLALRRLDPENHLWEALQKERAGERAAAAFETANQQERDTELGEISNTFERYRDSDFGRKLYLIQNSIYGVDIQPVATQIAKLRFFISLAIEQQPDPTSGNFGIQPLPNLETRFVAADSLLGLDNEAIQVPLGGPNRVSELNDHLRENREKHFHAGVLQEKLRLRREDTRLRSELAAELEKAGMSKSDAGKIARWDPYDQNSHAEWFDARYMFDVENGFDVVIGNPPYVQLQRDSGKLANLYRDAGFDTLARTGDLYQLFYEKGFNLLAKDGFLSYITSNSWLKAEYGKSTRRYVDEKHSVLRLLEMGKDVFENVIVDTSVLVAGSGRSAMIGKAVDMDRIAEKSFPPEEKLWSEFSPHGDNPWSVLTPIEQNVMDKMLRAGTPLKDWDIAINYGIKTGFNDAFIIDNRTKDALVAADRNSAEILKPVLRGRDIQRYQAQWAGMWLIDTHNGFGNVSAVDVNDYPAIKTHLDGFYDRLAKRYDRGNTPYNLRNCAYHANFTKEKLFWADMAAQGRFAFSDQEVYCNNKGYIMTGESLKYLCAVLNSSLIAWWVRNMAATTGMGLTEWTIVTVERLPVPKVRYHKQQPLAMLVDRILQTDGSGKEHDTRLESKIDSLVNELYGLNEDEIQLMASK